MAQHDQQKRNSLLQLASLGAAAGAAMLSPSSLAAPAPKSTITAAQALELLKEGNARFMADRPESVIQGKQRRLALARSQAPIAVLVSCSDSRVPPELLFGRGLGELFIIRNAGNTVDTVALGSIEYAVTQLNVPLVVVMGHERCGAVDAAVSVVEKQTVFPGSMGRMVEPIVPSVLQARAALGSKHTHDELLDASVRRNVQRVVKRLRESEALLLEPLRAGKLMIVGAHYDLDDGRVEFLEAGKQ
jgi:carbonic anhydrase